MIKCTSCESQDIITISQELFKCRRCQSKFIIRAQITELKPDTTETVHKPRLIKRLDGKTTIQAHSTVVKRMVATGYKHKEVCKTLGISTATINKILKGI